MSFPQIFVRLRNREFVVVEQKKKGEQPSITTVPVHNFRYADFDDRLRGGRSASAATGAEQGDEGRRRRCRAATDACQEQGEEEHHLRRRDKRIRSVRSSCEQAATGVCEGQGEEVRQQIKRRRKTERGNEKALPIPAAAAVTGYGERAMAARVDAVWQIAEWCGFPRQRLAKRACIDRDVLPFGEGNDKLDPWMCIDVRGLFPYDESPCECNGLGPIRVCHGTRNLEGILRDRGRLKPGPVLIGGQAGVRHDQTWWRPLSYSEPQLIGTCSFLCVLEIKVPSTRVGKSLSTLFISRDF